MLLRKFYIFIFYVNKLSCLDLKQVIKELQQMIHKILLSLLMFHNVCHQNLLKCTFIILTDTHM